MNIEQTLCKLENNSQLKFINFRTMKSCGGAIQSTVHDLNDETLGTCETFEEKQIGGERY